MQNSTEKLQTFVEINIKIKEKYLIIDMKDEDILLTKKSTINLLFSSQNKRKFPSIIKKYFEARNYMSHLFIITSKKITLNFL